MNILNTTKTSFRLYRADKLAKANKRRAAIDYLMAANAQGGSAAYEKALVELLLQGDTNPDPGAPPEVLPETVATGQPSIDASYGEIPEIQASEFSVDLMREAILQSGHLIVRGMFDSDTTTRLRECVDESLAARFAASQNGGPSDGPWFYHSPNFPGNHESYSQQVLKKKFGPTGSMRVIDSPRGIYTVLDVYRKYGIKQMLEDYFGEPGVVSTRKLVFRLVEPKEVKKKWIGGGWHQDGQFLGEGIRALNLWAPLSTCGDGTAAPGISLLPRRLEKVLEFGTHGAKLQWVVGSGLVEELAAETPVVMPRFEAGDALFFDHYSLHRSGHTPGKSENRYALESWFYAQSGTAGNAVLPIL